jgi:hypothetical protein
MTISLNFCRKRRQRLPKRRPRAIRRLIRLLAILRLIRLWAILRRHKMGADILHFPCPPETVARLAFWRTYDGACQMQEIVTWGFRLIIVGLLFILISRAWNIADSVSGIRGGRF